MYNMGKNHIYTKGKEWVIALKGYITLFYHDNNEHFISLAWHPSGICNVHFPSGNGDWKEFEKIHHTCDIDMFFFLR